MSDTTISPRDEELEKDIADVLDVFGHQVINKEFGGNRVVLKREPMRRIMQLIHAHDATREREIDNHILKIAMSADQKPDGHFGDDSRKAVLATLHGLHHYMDDRLATLNPKQQTGEK